MIDVRAVVRTRIPALAGIVVVALALCLGIYTRGSLPAAWSMVKIKPMPQPRLLFEDIQSITHSIDCQINGHDPYLASCDPWGRPLNYPAIWLDLRYLGVDSQSTYLLGIVFTLMTISTVLLLFRAERIDGGILVFLAVTSRSTLLAVERGNTDQMIFFLLVAGIFLISRLRPGLATVALAFLIAFLTGLKVYPAAAVVILLRNRKALWTAALTAAASVAALLLAGGHHLFQALSNTPQFSRGAFGSYPFFMELGHSAFPFLVKPVNAHHMLASIGAVILFAGSGAWAILSRDQITRILPSIDFDQPRGLIAISCLAIFCLAFIAGANFFYRLIFLLGVLAYLIEDLNEDTSRRSLAAAIAIVLFLWMPGRFILAHEFLDGLAFVGASAWLSSTLWKRLLSEHSMAKDAVPLIAR